MNQVHKESLDHVENALPNRQGLDVEIFGMEGLPEDVKKQHEERIVKNYFDAQRERFEATGNPPPGEGRPTKKIKIEDPEDLKKRFAEFRAKKAAAKAAGANGAPNPPVANVQSPGQAASPGTFVSSQGTLFFEDYHANCKNPELPIRTTTTLRTTWLSQLSSERRRPGSWLQSISTFEPSLSTSHFTHYTKSSAATRLPGKLLSGPSCSRLPGHWRINSR